MNACLSDFRVVNPTLRTFSAAEARIAQSSIRFNNLSAAELGYPENVRLLQNPDRQAASGKRLSFPLIYKIPDLCKIGQGFLYEENRR